MSRFSLHLERGMIVLVTLSICASIIPFDELDRSLTEFFPSSTHSQLP